MVLLENIHFQELKPDDFRSFKCLCELCDDGYLINEIIKLTNNFICIYCVVLFFCYFKGALID